MSEYIMYLRKSQMDRDFEDVSVEETLKRHKKILTDFCNFKKISVPIILEEVVSGELLSARPQMQRCLELINTGDYAGIVCMDIDRLSRGSSFDTGYIMQILQVNKCKIITPTKTYDLENEQDEQFTDMKFMFSRYELKTITKRLVQGRKMSASEGKHLSNAPYGYRKIKLQGEKGMTLQIDPDEAEIVNLIFDMYIEGTGYNTIAYKLNELNIPAYNNGKWSQTSVSNILTNPVYIGKIRYGYEKSVKQVINGNLVKKRKITGDYELHDGLHEAIVTQDKWDLAESVRLSRSNSSVPTDRIARNPFAEIMYCSNCGSIIRRNVADTKHPNTKPWYRCTKKSKNCDCGTMNCDMVEKAIVDHMREWLSQYTIEVKTKPVTDINTAAIPVLEKQLTEYLAQQEKICNLLETGIYSVAMFQKRNSILEDQIKSVSDRLKELKDVQNSKPTEQVIIPRIQHLLDTYDQLNPKEKNLVWKQILEKVTVYKPSGSNELNIELYPRLPK